MNTTPWSQNVILADADYVDKVAFDLIVNFERMIGRPIPKADMARWLECVALDGGMRNGEQETMVALVHQKSKSQLENFIPGKYDDELNGKAFKDQLGEFTINAYPIEEIAGTEDYFCEALELIIGQQEVKRVMVIPNAEDEHIYNKVRTILNRLDDERQQDETSAGAEKRITVFAMQPMQGGAFRQEILGYSLMAALGIRSEELKTDNG